jgi:HemY protein
MRAALWFLALFGLAVASALFAGNNQGTVSLFYPPYRIDFSLNFVLLVLFLAFALLYVALQAIQGLFDISQQARRWRAQQRERNMVQALLDAMTHFASGRFVRAKKASLVSLAQEKSLSQGQGAVPVSASLRSLSHLLAADSAHALQDKADREHHLQGALQAIQEAKGAQQAELQVAIQLRAVQWQLDDRDPLGALERVSNLGPGTGRRTKALRLKLRAAEQAGLHQEALHTTRLLAKHGAFSKEAANSLIRGLVTQMFRQAKDANALEQVWQELDASEKATPDLALEASARWLELGGSNQQVQNWLFPLWQLWPKGLTAQQQTQLVEVLTLKPDTVDETWLARIEASLQLHPRDALLNYLTGMACFNRSLWGKAQKHLSAAAPRLVAIASSGASSQLQRRAYWTLAQLAEQRNDLSEANTFWRKAAGKMGG